MMDKNKQPIEFIASKDVVLQIQNIVLQLGKVGKVSVEDCFVEDGYFVQKYKIEDKNKEVYHLDISFSLTQDKGKYSILREDMEKLMVASQMNMAEQISKI